MSRYLVLILCFCAATIASPGSAQSSAKQARANTLEWAECMWRQQPRIALEWSQDGFFDNVPAKYLKANSSIFDLTRYCPIRSPYLTQFDRIQSYLKSVERSNFITCIAGGTGIAGRVAKLGEHVVSDEDRAHYTPVIQAEIRAYAAKNGKLPTAEDLKIADAAINLRWFYDQPLPNGFTARAKSCNSRLWAAADAKGGIGRSNLVFDVLRHISGSPS